MNSLSAFMHNINTLASKLTVFELCIGKHIAIHSDISSRLVLISKMSLQSRIQLPQGNRC